MTGWVDAASGAPIDSSWVDTGVPVDGEWTDAPPCSADGLTSHVDNLFITGAPGAITSIQNDQSLWSIVLNDGTMTNDFFVQRYDDNGNFVDSPIWIARATGATTFAGPVVLHADPITPLGAATKQYVDNHGFLNDAPNDGQHYDRRNGAWALDPLQADALADGNYYSRRNNAWVIAPGGMLDAPADGTAYSRKNAGWVNLIHSDITDWAAALATALSPYALISSVPLASSATPLMDGTAAAGAATTWARGDHIHPTDTSRYAASNPSGYQTAAQVTTAINANNTANPMGWQTAAQVTASLAAYLPLTGGVLTGTLDLTTTGTANLRLNKSASGFGSQVVGRLGTSPRWGLVLGDPAAESGSNLGSNFGLSSYDDSGALLGTPLRIDRATGYVYIQGYGATPQAPATFTLGHAVFRMNKAGGGTGPQVQIMSQRDGSQRWNMQLANGVAESGSNVGSDFSLTRFDDTGTLIDVPVYIQRSTGVASFGPGTQYAGVAPAVGNAFMFLGKTASGNSALLCGGVGGQRRWQMQLGSAAVESGGNVGSDFILNNFDDSGTVITAVVTIARNTGRMTTSARFAAGEGYSCRPGTGGAVGGNVFNINYTGTVPQLWIDATNFGTFSFVSDYRTKKNIRPMLTMWDRVKLLRPVRYNHQDFGVFKGTPEEQWGFVAHELQETLTHSAATGRKDEEGLIQSPNPWTLLATVTKALQEAMARIEALEAKAA